MSPAATDYDVVVVGAGPYGLSAAAHLLGRGLRVGVFGKPLGLWRDHMPEGLLLRSHAWATNLSDPADRYRFVRFARETGARITYPIPRQVFIDYGLWFQRRAVPAVDETFVSSIDATDEGFWVTLADGRCGASRAVVLAVGPSSYAHRPPQFAALPPGCVSHSSEQCDLARFSGRRVVVVGGGQSAIESAALLVEAGALVEVVARRPIEWRDPDRLEQRSTIRRLMAPAASIAPGWDYWLLDHMPYAFYNLPQHTKDSYNANYSSGASDWLRHRVLGKVELHESQVVCRAEMSGDRVLLRLSNGRALRTDHVMLATGFRVDLSRLSIIAPSLRSRIGTRDATPLLTSSFESTVPGLYFIGLTALRAFGPIYRFVAGCGAAARRVAADVGRRPATSRHAARSVAWSTSAS